MKNYIRVCISLDEETIDLLKSLKKWCGKSNSEIIRKSIKRYGLYYIPARVKEK